MAYREFDPAAMEDYRDSTVQMFQDQRDFAESKVSQLTAKISVLDIKIAALDTKIALLNSSISNLSNSNKDGKNDSAISSAMENKQAAEQDKEAAETERTNAQDAVDKLNQTMEQIDGAIQKTNAFIGNLLSKVGSTDEEFRSRFDKLVEQIDGYKSEMKEIYNSVDTTLRNHGYSGDVNLKKQFSSTVDDFADSTMINTFPYIPASYIYSGGVLKDRILNGIFQKDVSKIKDDHYRAVMEKLQNEENQYDNLIKVLDRIAINSDLKNLAKFISCGYEVTKSFSSPVGLLGTDYTRVYEISKSFILLTQKYLSKYQTQLIDNILLGKSIYSISDEMCKKLQIGSLLQSFASQNSLITALTRSPIQQDTGKLDDLGISIIKDSIKNVSGLSISMNGSTGDKNWFVSDFLKDLNTNISNFKNGVYGQDNQGYGLSLFLNGTETSARFILSILPIVSNFYSVFSTVEDFYNAFADASSTSKTSQINIDTSKLESYFTKLTYGGVLISDTQKRVIVSNPILDLNGSSGAYLSAEAKFRLNGGLINSIQMYKDLYQSTDWSAITAAGYDLENLCEWIRTDATQVPNFDKAVCYAGGADYPLTSYASYEEYNYVIENRYDKIKEWYAINNIPFGGI